MTARWLDAGSRPRLLLHIGAAMLIAAKQAACVRAPPPRLVDSVSMANITAMRGDTVEFRCRVENLGKHMIFKHHDKYELKPRVNADEWVLRIKDVQETDAGGYICQLNTNPALSIIGYLDIKVPPAISRSSTPSAVEVPENHNITLSCHADGNPPPTVIWRRADRQIIRYNGANGYGDSVYKGADLQLTRVSRKHMSEYVCVASNGIPPDESWTIKLHVLFEPLVVPQAAVIEAPVGAPAARLVCNVEAWPRPHVTWLLNDVELYDSNRYSTEQSVADRYRSLHVLEVKDITADQFGRYRCVAANDYGRHYADIQLIEAPPPPLNAYASLLSEGTNFNVNGQRRRNKGADDSIESATEGGEEDQEDDDDDDEFYWIPKVSRDGRTALVFASAAGHRRRSEANGSHDMGNADNDDNDYTGNAHIENELTRAIVEDNKRFIDYYRELRHRKNVRTDDGDDGGDGNGHVSGAVVISQDMMEIIIVLCNALLAQFIGLAAPFTYIRPLR